MDVLNLLKLPYRVHMENYAEFEEKFFAYMKAIENEKTIADMIYKNGGAGLYFRQLSPLPENADGDRYSRSVHRHLQ